MAPDIHTEDRANICFDCQRACGGCSWSELDPETGEPRFEPVPGWTATPSIVRHRSREITVNCETYHITACPLFVPEDPTRYEKVPTGRSELVICVETGRIFSSAIKASEWLGLHQGAVTSSMRRGCKAGGYHWAKYEEAEV